MSYQPFTGIKAVEGLLLGAGAAAINLAGLWYLIRLFCNPRPGENVNARTGVMVFACFLKMPTFIVAGLLAWRIGAPAPPCFLAAVFLVYSVVIQRVARTR